MGKEEKEMYIFSGILVLISLIGIFSLQGGITGFAVQETLLEGEFVLAMDSLIEAEANIIILNNSNLSTFLLKDKLLESKKYFLGDDFPELSRKFDNLQDTGRYDYSRQLLDDYSRLPRNEREKVNYTKSIQFSQEINERKNKALDLLDRLNLLKDQEKEASKKKINTEEALILINQAEIALKEERYEEAGDKLSEAKTILENESRDFLRIARLTKNFLVRFWWQSLIGVVVIVYLGIFIYKKTRIRRAKNKIKNYKIELDTLQDLMKEAQHKRFREGKMSASLYNIKMDKYRDKMNKIKSQIPVLEGVINPKEKEKKKLKKGKKKFGGLKVKR